MNVTRILIVDDHKIMLAGLRYLLSERAAFQVVGEAGDAQSAVVAVDSLRPDLVLMDLDLPGGDGITLTRQILQTHPGLKVLILTGRVEERLVSEAMMAGAQGYLLKSNGSVELIAAIGTVMAGRTYLCADAARTMREGRRGGNPLVLPQRESEVLEFILAGSRNKEIAVKLGIGVKSVETYRARLMKRLACSSPAELVRAAIRSGLAAP